MEVNSFQNLIYLRVIQRSKFNYSIGFMKMVAIGTMSLKEHPKD